MDLCLALRTQTTKWTQRRPNIPNSNSNSLDCSFVTIRGLTTSLARRNSDQISPTRVRITRKIVHNRHISISEGTNPMLIPIKPSQTHHSCIWTSPVYKGNTGKVRFPSTPREELHAVVKGRKAVLSLVRRSKARTVSEATYTELQ